MTKLIRNGFYRLQNDVITKMFNENRKTVIY